MEETWSFIKNEALPHWPFVFGYISFVVIGYFMKAQVWTKARANKPGKLRNFFHFMRRTLAMHAPVAGVLYSLMPDTPVSPGVEGMGAEMLYWGGCGMASSFSFHAVSKYIKGKTGVDLDKAITAAVSPSMTPDDPDKTPPTQS